MAAVSAKSSHPPHSHSLSPPDASLLDFYLANVSSTHSRPSLALLARTTVVDIGFEYPFLLHALLASAAHLKALSAPSGGPVYFSAIAQAAEHENLSMSLFRDNVREVTRENIDAVFMYTIMASIFVYSSFSPKLNPDAPQRYHQLTKGTWIRMLHGITTVIPVDAWSWIESKPVSAFMYSGCWEEASPPDDPVFQPMHHQFLQLSQLWHVGCDPPHRDPTAAAEIFDTALTDLLNTLARVALSSQPTTSDPEALLPAGPACGWWLQTVQEEFLACLDNGDTEALILLAYWGVLQSKVKDAWWMSGMGENVV